VGIKKRAPKNLCRLTAPKRMPLIREKRLPKRNRSSILFTVRMAKYKSVIAMAMILFRRAANAGGEPLTLIDYVNY